MSGRLRNGRPTNKVLLTKHDWFTAPGDIAGTIFLALGAKSRRKLRSVAAYYDWQYEEVWGEELTQTDRRNYAGYVLEKYLILSSLTADALTNLGRTTWELLEYGPGTEAAFVDMYYRSSFLPEDERTEMREEYENNHEKYEHLDPIPRAVRIDRVLTE